MSLKNVKYDAFISYRHSELDKFIAMSIQRKLENFKLPKSLNGKTNGRTKIERVFRDQDELPLASNLSDPIEEALQNSDYLIVICTPRLPESAWCTKEIDTFIRMHGRDNVLAVLAEGEPEQSFPESLRFAKKIRIDELGNETEETVEIEPLAADTRGETLKERKKMIDDATLRLAAPIFGLNYDDLKQRHKEQRTKRILTVASIAASIFFVFALVCMGLALRINSQKNTIADQYSEIEAKNEKIEANNREIVAQSAEILRQSEEISRQYRAEQLKYAESMADASKELLTGGLKLDALYAVRNAMPATVNSAGVPYSAAAERALTDALGIYNRDLIMTPTFKYELRAAPSLISCSSDGETLVAADSKGLFYVFDTSTGKEKVEFSYTTPLHEEDISWLSDTSFVYSDKTGIHIYDTESFSDVHLGDEMRVVDEYVISNDRKTIYVSGFDSTEERIYVDSYSVEQNYEKADRIYAGEKIEGLGFWGGTIRKMGINEADTILYFLMKKDDGVSGVDDKTTYILSGLNLSDNTATATEIVLGSYTDSLITDDTVIVVSTRARDANGIVYDSRIEAYDVSDGTMKWAKDYPDKVLSEASFCRPNGESTIVLDGNGVIVLLALETGEELHINSYDSVLCKGSFLENEDISLRLMYMQNGNVCALNFSPYLLIDYSAQWYKYMPVQNVSLCDFGAGKTFFCYEKESYIAEFERPNNAAAVKEELFVPADASGYCSSVFSSDYRYEVISWKKDGICHHVLYDVNGQSVLCEVEDDNSSAAFLPDGTKRFYTYSTASKLYSASGELLNSVENGSVGNGSFGYISNNGKYLVRINQPTGSACEHCVYSPEEGQIIATFTTERKVNSVLVDDTAGRVFLLDDETLCVYGINDPSAPIASMEITWNFIKGSILSTDGKYLFLEKQNEAVEIYTAENLSYMKTLYGTISGVSDVRYLETESEYLMVSDGGINVILSDNLECKKVVYDCVGYAAEKNAYITKTWEYLGYIGNASYEELIKKADAELAGYEPSEFIKDKYHID